MNPKRLIEEWLPIKEIGIESRRERAASTALPPLYYLHVWWARRPLPASRAAILGSLLPAWEGNGELLGKHFDDEDEYRRWFLRMLGILGDPVAAQDARDRARARNVRLAQNPFNYPRAFSTEVDDDDLKIMRAICQGFMGVAVPRILDPMSGGGSIPFESLRLGLPTWANELNPVACTVLEATLDYPLRFGALLIQDILDWGNRIDESCRENLSDYFPARKDEQILDYIWARTVPCPTTGKPVPLSPNWWLKRETADSVAAHMLPCEEDWEECRFEIVRGRQADLEKRYAPSQGTIRRGNAVSPWSGDPVPGDYIKQVAQSGGMGAQLFALCTSPGRGRDYRLPTDEDLSAIGRAQAALAERWDDWLAADLIPTETVPHGNKTAEPLRYGMDRWHKLFAPRQLLAMLTYLETLLELAPEMERDLGKERAAAVRTYLAVVLDKCANWECDPRFVERSL